MSSPSNRQEEKARLRREMLARRRALAEEEVERRSAAVQARLLAHPGFRQARAIALYLGVRGEVKTDRLLAAALQAGKRVAAPIADHQHLSLHFAEIHQPERDLQPGQFGLLEPSPIRCAPIEPNVLDCIVVPGVVFDRQGFRLGHGKGFYDRFLPRLRPDCLRVGLAYDFQVVERVPTDPQDVRLHLLVTETATYAFQDTASPADQPSHGGRFMSELDRVRLVNMAFYAYHGTMPEEATLGQRFNLDVELATDLEQPGRTDDLRQTVDYEKVYRLIAETVHSRRFKLLEALAQAVADAILGGFPSVQQVTVRVRKPSVSLGGLLDYAEVEIERNRLSSTKEGEGWTR